MHMHRAEFGAAMQCRDGLAGIEQTVRIECGFDGVELGQLRSAELDAHRVDLFDADAVFAGDGAADFNTQQKDAEPPENTNQTQPKQPIGTLEAADMTAALMTSEEEGHGDGVSGAEIEPG